MTIMFAMGMITKKAEYGERRRAPLKMFMFRMARKKKMMIATMSA